MTASRHFRVAALFLAVLAAEGAVFGQDATSKQIPAGTSATITPAKITPATGSARQKKMLDAALTSETRQTLQQAMDSVGDSPSR